MMLTNFRFQMIRSISIVWRFLLIFSLLLPNVGASSVSAKSISPLNKPNPKQVMPSEQPPHPRPTIVRPQPRIGNRPDSNENASSKAQSLNSNGKSAAKPLPLTFIENKGQFSPEEMFRLSNGQATIQFAQGELWITLLEDDQISNGIQKQSPNKEAPAILTVTPEPGDKSTQKKGVHVRMNFVGANPAPQVEGIERLDTHVSYLIGNDPLQWHTDVPVWSGIRYKGLYPGIDLEINSVDGQWNWQLVAQDISGMNEKSGNSFKQGIRLKVDGSNKLNINKGSLEISTDLGNVNLPILRLVDTKKTKLKANKQVLDAPIIDGNELVIMSPDLTSAGTPDVTSIPENTSTPTPTQENTPTQTSTQENTQPNPENTSTPTPTQEDTQPNPENTSTPTPNLENTQPNPESFTLTPTLENVEAEPATAFTPTPTQEGVQSQADNIPASTSIPENVFNALSLASLINSVDLSLTQTTLISSTIPTFYRSISSSFSPLLARKNNSISSPVQLSRQTDSGIIQAAYHLHQEQDSEKSSILLSPNYSGIDDVTFSRKINMAAVYGNAVDSDGASYLVGWADSTGFPTSTGAFQPTGNGSNEATVVKLSQDGSQIIYATYIGGSAPDFANGVAVDSLGYAYIVGTSFSSDFPGGIGQCQGSSWGGADAFVIKLNQTGTSPIYSMCIGGTGDDQGYNIALNSSGEAYIVGQTSSYNLPIRGNAIQTVKQGLFDGFVGKIAADGSQILSSTYFGGSQNDCELAGVLRECDIALDESGYVYITGPTYSPNFPEAASSYNGGEDAFIFKMTPDLSDYVYSTYLGKNGANRNERGALAVDSSNSVYVIGSASNSTKGMDVFLTKLSPNGKILYSNFIGGNNDDWGKEIVVNAYGEAYITGMTNSNDFPFTEDALQTTQNGTQDAFVVKINPDGDVLYSTYLGGNSNDGGETITLDNTGMVYTAGWSQSGDFLTKPTGLSGAGGGFVTKINLGQYNIVKDISSHPCGPCEQGENVKDTRENNSAGGTQGQAGDPINTRNGGFDHSVGGLAFPTDAGEMGFEISYSSLSTSDFTNLLGYGWTHNQITYLTFQSGVVQFKAHSLNIYSFTENEDGTYTTEPGTTYHLVRQEGPPVTYEITSQDQSKYTFDENGKLLDWADSLGRNWTYTYDTNGRLDRVTDDTGLRYLDYSYDAQGRVDTVSDHAGRNVHLGYDTAGDLSTLSDVLGGTWNLTYDGSHRLRIVSNPAGINVVHTEYDALGRAYRQYKSQNDLVLEVTYHADGTSTISKPLENSQTDTYNTLNTRIMSGRGAGNSMKNYDANFRPAGITDENGDSSSLSWSPDGANLVKIVDPLGSRTDLIYNSLNGITEVIDPRQYSTQYIYDEDNPDPHKRTLLLSVSDPYSHSTQYTYTTSTDAPAPEGLLKTITDPLNHVTTYAYDQFGQRISMEDADQRMTYFTYDALGRQKTVRDSSNRVSWTCYDAAGRTIRAVENASGDGSSSETDPCNAESYQPSSDPLMDRITTILYDDSGNVIATTDPSEITTRTYYDEYNRPTTMVQNWVGQNIRTDPAPTYDPQYPDQNIRTETTYDILGRSIATTDSNGIITRTYYDGHGRVQYVVQNLSGQAIDVNTPPTYDPSYPDRNIFSQTVYDPAGKVIASVAPNGVITRTYYDASDLPIASVQHWVGSDLSSNSIPAYNSAYPDRNVVTRTGYDAAGNAIVSIDVNGSVTRTYYDALNRPMTVIQHLVGWDPNSESAPTCAQVTCNATQNLFTDYVYDAAGNLIATIDPRNITTRTYFDELNRPVTVIQNWVGTDLINGAIPTYDPDFPDDNVRTDTFYSEDGNTIANQQYNGTGSVITRTYYDDQNRPIRVVRNWNGADLYSETIPDYDPQYPDRNVQTETVYDNRGDVIATIDNGGSITRTYYDQLHRAVLVVQNLSGQAISNPIPPTYDPDFPDRNVRTETVYDGVGRVLRTIDSAGKETFSCYNSLGQTIKNVENPTTSTPCGTYTPSTNTDQDITTQYVYDLAGNLASQQDPTGKVTAYQYDALNRQIAQAEAFQLVSRFTYDEAGNKLTQTDGNGVVTCYEYDASNRLKAVVENCHPGFNPTSEINVRTEYTYDASGNRLTIVDGRGKTTTFGYDDLNRMVSEEDALDHLTTSTYDALGNRLQTIDANGATINFQYDALNRPVLIDYPSPDNDVTFTYDAAGNRSSMADGQGTTQWDYDQLNRPTSITDPVTGAVQYGYDAAGRRTALTYPDSKQVTYVYDDAGRLHLVTDWDSLITTYTYDRSSRPVTLTRPNDVATHYQYDASGQLSAISNTDTSQTLSSFQYGYDAAGNRTSVTETTLQQNPPSSDVIFADGFESGNLSAWSASATDGGDLSVTTQSAISGTDGLQLVLNDNNSIYVTDQTPSAAAHYRARFYFDPNSIAMGNGDALYLFYGLNSTSDMITRVEFRFSSGDYQVRAEAISDGSTWSSTPWVTILDGPHALELEWKAATSVGANDGILALWIDGTQQANISNLDNDTRVIDTVQLGAVAGVDSTTRGTCYMDAFVSHTTNYIGLDANALTPPTPPAPGEEIFANGFESGSLAQWSQSTTGGGDLSVTTAAAMANTYGMQALINDNTSIYVTDWSPYNETRYRARFYFDPNSIVMANNDAFYLFYAFDRANTVVARVELRYSVGDYQIRADSVTDAGTWSQTGWYTILDGPHALELDWTASTATGSNNGGLTLWIDGNQKEILTGIDNDTLHVDYMQVGAVSGVDNGTRGTAFFDGFVSKRTGYIGQDPNALLPPTRPDLVFQDGFEAGNLSAWTASMTDGGDLSVNASAAILGSQGLQVLFDDGNPKYVTDWSPSDETHFWTRFYFDPNSIVMANNDTHYIYYALDRSGNVVITRVELRSNMGDYQVRVDTIDDATTWSSTPWVTLQDCPHAIELEWKAATAPTVYDGYLSLWVDGTQQSTLNALHNDARRVDMAELGAIPWVMYSTHGTYYLDGFVSQRSGYIGLDAQAPVPPAQENGIFADGFEGGNLASWTFSDTDRGDLGVTSPAAIIGSKGMRVLFDDNNPKYVTDWSPVNENEYHARFYLDPNSLSMAEGDAFYLLKLYNRSGTEEVRVEFGFSSDRYRIRMDVVNDTGRRNATAWYFLTDWPHGIEIDWKSAASIYSSDGELTLYVDGYQRGNIASIDNDQQRVDYVDFGAVQDIDTGTRGTLYLDGFVSQRTGSVGLDPSVPNPIIFVDGFESGGLTAWSSAVTDSGDLSTTSQAAILGSHGLQAVLNDNNPLYLVDNSPQAEKNITARFYFDPNSISMSDGDSHYLFKFKDNLSDDLARIEFRFKAGDYQVRSQIINDSSVWSNTPWITITDGPHALEIDWKAASLTGANDGSLAFWVDGILQTNLANLDNDTFLADSGLLGITDGVNTGTRGTEYFDAFESHRDGYIGLDPTAPNPPQPPTKGDSIFSDGFETGSLSAWPGSNVDEGDLSVTSQAAIIGTKGMQASIQDNNSLYVTDWSPFEEVQYRARFYFDPNSVTMAASDAHYIFEVYNRNDLTLIRIEVSLYQGDYQVRAEALDDLGIWHSTDWIAVSDAPHAYEIEWKCASAPLANDGEFYLWIDGVDNGSITGLDNDSYLVDYARLGAVEGIDAGTRGTEYFDGFISNRYSWIGLDSGITPPDSTDLISRDTFETGDLSSWTISETDAGDLAVSSASAIVGSKGLQAVINDNHNIYVVDRTPYQEDCYQVRFYFDPNSISMTSGDTHTILEGEDWQGQTVFRLEFRFSAGEYQVREEIADDFGIWTYSDWSIITDGPHAIELHWTADISGGVLVLWIDDTQVRDLTGIDNDTRRIDTVKLGVIDGIDEGTRGTEYFDDFVSHRFTYIGLDSGALPAPPLPGKYDDIFYDNFETGDLSAWTPNVTDGGDLSVSTQAAISGTWGLQALIDDNNSLYVNDWSPYDENHYRARFYFDPNSITMASGDVFSLFEGYNRYDTALTKIDLRYLNGEYQLSSSFLDDTNSWIDSPWVSISDEPHAVEILWWAAGHDGADDGGLFFWVDDNLKSWFGGADNDQRWMDYARLGAVEGVDSGTRGTLYLDDFASARQEYIGLDEDAIQASNFTDGFETGNFLAWNSAETDGGDLSITAQAAITGSLGLQANINDNNVIRLTRQLLNPVSRLYTRFYFDPNSIEMGDNDQQIIYRMLDTEINSIGEIDFRFSSGDYQLRAVIADNSYNATFTPWFTITDGPHAVEIYWRSATTPQAGDGGLTLWLDGVQISELTEIQNDLQSLDSFRLGAQEWISSTTRGTYYFDGFETNVNSYIGLDPNAQEPPAPPEKTDALFSDGFEDGTYSAWGGNVMGGEDLSVTSQAAISGNRGLQVAIGDNYPRYLTDWTPVDENQYRARFYFDPNSLTMSDGDNFTLLMAQDREHRSQAVLEFGFASGDYRIRERVIDDSDNYIDGPWTYLLDGPHCFEISWAAATAPQADNGSLTLWIDGVEQPALTGVDNDTRLIDTIQLGVGIADWIDDGTRGTVYFDGFESRRDTYIGLDPNALPTAGKTDDLFDDGFETGDFSAWSSSTTDGGHLSVSNASAIVGSKGMQAYINDNNSLYVRDNSPLDETHYRARFYFDPNSVAMNNGETFMLLDGLNRYDGREINIEFGMSQGDYQVRANEYSEGADWQATPWTYLMDGPHAFEIDWKAASCVSTHDGNLTLWMDGVQLATLTNLDNDEQRIDYARLGAIEGVGNGTRGTVYFDGFVSHRSTYIGLDGGALPAPTKTDALFSDGYETGNFSAWSSSATDNGHLSVSTASAIVGSKGMQAYINDNNALYVTDNNPFSETHYRARFYFDPNSITMATNDVFTLFDASNRSGAQQMSVEFGRTAADYQVRAGVRNDAGTLTYMAYTYLMDGPHAFEIEWKAASSVNTHDGVLTLWMDGAQLGSLTGVDNDTATIDSARLGGVSGIDTGTRGTVYIDGFVSHRETYIGLDGSALPAPSKTDALFSDGYEAGYLSAWSSSATDSGHLSVSTAAAIVGSKGMQAYINDNTALYVTDNNPFSETHYRARFYFDPNNIVMAANNVFTLFDAASRDATQQMSVEFGRTAADFQVRAGLRNDAGTWSYLAYTNLMDGPHAFEIEWKAAAASGANDGLLTLWMDGAQIGSLTGVDNDAATIDSARLGGVTGIDTGTRGTVYFDGFVSQRVSYVGLDGGALPAPSKTDDLFADGFEGNSLAAWSGNTPDSGHLTVTSGAAIFGSNGLNVYINDNNSLYVTDITPFEESHYRAHFHFKPNGITMATNDAHYIFYGLDRSGAVQERIEFGKSSTGYQVRAGVLAGGSWTTTNWVAITNAAHYLETDWQASTASSSPYNGVFTFWVDGTQSGTYPALNTYGKTIDYVQLGAVSGVDTGTRGTEFFDAFNSHRSSYIGTATSMVPAPENQGTMVMAAYHPDSLLLKSQSRQGGGVKLASLDQAVPSLRLPLTAPADQLVGLNISYTYDALGRLTRADYSDGSFFHYTYDEVGNRLSMTTQLGTVNYVYDDANRLASVGGVSYTWDNNGNLLSDGSSAYSYDHANRLKSVVQGSNTYTYAYNGLGNRVSQTLNAGTPTRYVLDQAAGLVQVLSDGISTYLYGNDRLAQQSTTDTEYFLTDALGSVRQLTNSDGEITLNRSYDPYGNVLASSGDGESVFAFTGEQMDSYSNLLNLRSRLYSPSMGRFMSRDTWQGDVNQPMSYNAWLYTYSNPINYADPSGYWRWWFPKGIYHLLIEQYYEGLPNNQDKQLEFPIPGTPFRHPDMFNSTIGDIYEIEPWNKQSDALPQVLGYTSDLLTAARMGPGTLSGTYLGASFNWNSTPFHIGTGIDWPGKVSRPLPNFPAVNLVADFVGNGAVIYWLEPNALVLSPLPFLVPNKSLVKPRNWVPGRYAPQPVTAIDLPEACGYGLIMVGGTILVVTTVEDIATLGLGTFDDAITVPAGIVFINLGQRLAVFVPATAP